MLLGTAVFVGFATGIGAVVFRWLIEAVSHLSFDVLPGLIGRGGMLHLVARAHPGRPAGRICSSTTSRVRRRATACRRSWPRSRFAGGVSVPWWLSSSRWRRRCRSAAAARSAARGRSCRSARRSAPASASGCRLVRRPRSQSRRLRGGGRHRRDVQRADRRRDLRPRSHPGRFRRTRVRHRGHLVGHRERRRPRGVRRRSRIRRAGVCDQLPLGIPDVRGAGA